jgi:hypothetical protein
MEVKICFLFLILLLVLVIQSHQIDSCKGNMTACTSLLNIPGSGLPDQVSEFEPVSHFPWVKHLTGPGCPDMKSMWPSATLQPFH